MRSTLTVLLALAIFLFIGVESRAVSDKNVSTDPAEDQGKDARNPLDSLEDGVEDTLGGQ